MEIGPAPKPDAPVRDATDASGRETNRALSNVAHQQRGGDVAVLLPRNTEKESEHEFERRD